VVEQGLLHTLVTTSPRGVGTQLWTLLQIHCFEFGVPISSRGCILCATCRRSMESRRVDLWWEERAGLNIDQDVRRRGSGQAPCGR